MAIAATDEDDDDEESGRSGEYHRQVQARWKRNKDYLAGLDLCQEHNSAVGPSRV